jgi:hypothetical protein
MNYIEINEQLKAMISDLVDLGYKKTVIGKLLLGSSGYAPIIKYLENDANIDLNLGVKPLTKVGNAVNYDLRLVYVKQDNHDMINGIQEVNNAFFEDLRNGIIKYMNSDEYNTRKPYTVKNRRTNQFDAVLNDILFSDIISDEDTSGPKLE